MPVSTRDGLAGAPTDWAAHIESLLPAESVLERCFDRLWPICRSLAGPGFRESLKILSEIAGYQTFEVPTGTKVFDWKVPKEWSVREAYLEDPAGRRIVDFKTNNLHVMSYSTPVDTRLPLDELQKNLHSMHDRPGDIPYRTSYYKESWGFCLTDRQRRGLKKGVYHAVIRSELKAGSMTLAHKILPATEPGGDGREILFSTYLCHPSMANNELSGPLVTTFLYDCLKRIPKRRYTYRFVVVPETIGSIAYLSRFGKDLKKRLHAGYVVTCVGDDKNITYKKSRRGTTEGDRVALQELTAYGKPFHSVDFFPSGSDERQYCSPGFDLPVGSLMRSMYGTYGEYHTSADDKNFISFRGLRESIALYLRIALALEFNRRYRTKIAHGEPMLSSHGLYPTVGAQTKITEFVNRMMWIINQSDGTADLCAIAELAGRPIPLQKKNQRCSILDLEPIVRILMEKGVLTAAPTRRAAR